MQGYRLNTVKNNLKKRYRRQELEEMTTFQLKNICLNERIVKSVINNLDRENFIETILKYRGIKESYLINEFNQEGYNKLSDILKNCLVNKLQNRGKIKIPAKITLYEEIGINKEDKYTVTVENNEIGESNVLVVNENNDLCGVFNLVADDIDNKLYYLVVKENITFKASNNKNYSLLFFQHDDSESIYRAYHSDMPLSNLNLKYYKIAIPTFEVRKLEETSAVLAIDFGTSNTTAGAYLNINYTSQPCYNDVLNHRIKLSDINLVKFKDVTRRDERWIEVLPTIVYIDDCSDSENIKYSFGYEAEQKMKRNDYICTASVFQGIKRWINSYTKIEEIFDEEGYSACVKRSEIIKAYLNHIINVAEHQFKCKFKKLHISSPVKLKNQFIEMFNEIMPEYEIEEKEALDEGVAVLYNTIEKLIQNKSFDEDEEYKALIIDCGGGTTDLSSCSFRIEEGNISYKLKINTTYENGDTNFGGNNITYRIMQFIKIILSGYYMNEKNTIDIDDLIDVPSTDIFRYVDEMGKEKLYEEFQKAYDYVEDIIPTRFKQYENKSKEEYARVKNNYYFLWEIADNMKKEFYKKTNVFRTKFNSFDEEKESDLMITPLKKWDLSILKKGKLTSVYEFPDVVFNVKEINKLIEGDIYEVIRKFLDSFYENGRLQEYSIIKLTGQSCKIEIFKEALKEFVPGKSIEFKQKKEEDEEVSDLKLSCLKGVIRYLYAKNMGNIEVNIKNEVPIVPYSVSTLTYNNSEVMMICSLEKINKGKGSISRPIGTQTIGFLLKNVEGKLRHEYVYINNYDDYEAITEKEITGEYYGKIYQDDIDTISNKEIKFFVFAHEKSWGFYVLPIQRENDQLYVGKKKYFAFENDLSELDFFDGLK
jgi:hypothetical protein